jgi:molybdenum cofactor cytidylyltransferase
MPEYHAILLAAGSGSRFDPLGIRNKLLQPLPDGCTVAVAAAASLLAIMPRVLAVVRPDADQLGAELKAIGCEVITCTDADEGMGATLAHAVRQRVDAAGWIVALADMPYLKPATIRALLNALRDGADIAAPSHGGQRGNPVGFSRLHLDELLQLSGDVGARRLLNAYPVQWVEVDDPGIHFDIDRPQDLPLH